MIDPTHAAMCMAEHQQQAEIARLRAALRATERERDALRGLAHYRAHARNCAVGMTEVCTCGLREAVARCRTASAPQTPSEGGTDGD